MVGVVGDADALGPGVFGVGLGATDETKRKLFFHKNWKKQRKESRFSLCLVKGSYISYNMNQ
jgi:hypothetical protein